MNDSADATERPLYLRPFRAYHPRMRSGHPRSASIGAAFLFGSLAAATLSCRPPRPCAAVPSSATAPTPRLDHCLAPPWVVDPARPESGVDGWSAAVCPVKGPGRSAYFVHEGTRAITGPEAHAVLDAVRSGRENGLGGCCSAAVEKDIKILCLKVQSGLCREPMNRVVQLVDRVLRHRGLADVRIGVDVTLDGEVGPRCEPTDPGCGPVPARKRDAAPPRQTACVAGRALLGGEGDEAARGRGRTCAHDGECLVVGCARECLRWDQNESLTWCDLVYEPSPKQPPTYCGCVAGHCDWFRPAAP